jgi:Ni,Fe-hydrogenase I large subunit
MPGVQEPCSGIELILRGRDPREAWIWTQRICGVCTTVHALTSVRAVEDALGIEVPENASLIRNIIGASQYVQDHVIHFYHLHALDWVDVTWRSRPIRGKRRNWRNPFRRGRNPAAHYFKAIQDRVKTLVESKQLSLFSSGYWGHPAYHLPPEANLLAVAHYVEALEFQRDYIRIHAVLGGKNPHLQTYLVGGMSTAMDPNEPGRRSIPSESLFSPSLASKAQAFVDQVYIPDVLAVAGFYRDWFERGEGLGNFLSYGDYPQGGIKDPSRFYLQRGAIFNHDLSKVYPVDPANVTEYVTHSWYQYADGDQNAKHPYQGETSPKYTGPKPPFEHLEIDQKYSWLKAPRYQDHAMEVGPLSRMLVAYASGHPEVKAAVDGVLAKLNAPATALFSTLGRIAARAIEAHVMAGQVSKWVAELGDKLGHGDLRMHNGEKWDPDTWPKEAQGFGFHEAPRGSLGHWVHIEDKKITNYQCVVPTTWNAGPRDAKGQRGAYEASLLKTPIADPERPLEILRTIHSFDPCLACAVHVVDGHGRRYTVPWVS